MGYTKVWVPPSVPPMNNLTIWKLICNDIHTNILAAGLVQTSTPGQLVIDDVSTLPAINVYAGFIEYALDDDWQSALPVKLRLTFGVLREGIYNTAYSRSNTLSIQQTVIVGDANAVTIICPQSFPGASDYQNNTPYSSPGFSAFCYNKDRGFLGLFYGVGSRNKPHAYGSGSYYSGSLCVAIQRELDMDNNPTSAGAAFTFNMDRAGGDNLIQWPNAYDSSYTYYRGGAINTAHNRISYRQGRSGISTTGSKVLIEPINYPKLLPTPFPYLYSYRSTDIPAGDQFTMKAVTGEEHNFIALGNETGFIPDMIDMGNAGICMLFE